MVPTVASNIRREMEEISALLANLLLEHSTIYKWNTPNDYVTVLSASGNYAYRKLSEDGLKIQARLLDKYQKHYAILSVLLRSHPQNTQTQLEKTHKAILRTIEQEHTGHKTTKAALEAAQSQLQKQAGLLDGLYGDSAGGMLIIPDTNALLFNPDIELWAFDEFSSFTIILVTTVISELDRLKIEHRNESVRDKADKLIRKFKEYRRRGSLTEGVTVVKDRIFLRATAVEVNMAESLPWLDAGNNDDRILAGVLEVMHSFPQSAVIAVSRDLNFQNKAEFAHISCIEPPAP